MERLTIRNSDGSVSQPTATTIEAVFQRLAAYEDTGMTPEQIRNAQDTLQCFDNIGIKRGNEIVKAEEDGRLLAPPCKVGQRVYFVLEDLPCFYPETNGWYISESEVSEVCTRGFAVDPINIDEKILFYPYSDIGKNAFLSREEAVAALEEIRHENP